MPRPPPSLWKAEKVEKLTKAQIAAQEAKKSKEDAAKLKKGGKVEAKAAAATPVPVKPGSKIAPKKPGESETPGDADSPLLDMSDVGVRKMIAKAKARGYVTYDELNKVLPSDKTSSEQIEDTMAMLNEMGINVIESEEAEEGEEGSLPVAADGTGKALATTAKSGEQYDRTDDPVRMYLREMGSVELLSREGEIAIAKRIEAGRELMIGALCESPLTFEALTVWRDELNEGKVLLRDIIDLEAMYGAGPDGQPANVPPPVGPDGQPLVVPASANATPHAVVPPPEFKKPEPPKPAEPKADGETTEGGEGQPPADDGDDFDDEGNLPLSAMEAALKPQVLASLDAIAGLYKKLGKLQDASVEAALASDELSTGQERRFKKLRNETMDLVKSLKLNNNRIEALVDQMYGINKRLVGPGKASCCAWPKAMAWTAPNSSNSISATSLTPTGPAVWVGCRASAGTTSSPTSATRSSSCVTTSSSWRRKLASRSANSAAMSRPCRRANANPASPRRR